MKVEDLKDKNFWYMGVKVEDSGVKLFSWNKVLQNLTAGIGDLISSFHYNKQVLFVFVMLEKGKYEILEDWKTLIEDEKSDNNIQRLDDYITHDSRTEIQYNRDIILQIVDYINKLGKDK